MKLPDNINRTIIVSIIDEWVVGEHAERDRKILYRRLIDGITFEKLAEEFSLSDRRVKDIVYKREKQIFKHFD